MSKKKELVRKNIKGLHSSKSVKLSEKEIRILEKAKDLLIPLKEKYRKRKAHRVGWPRNNCNPRQR